MSSDPQVRQPLEPQGWFRWLHLHCSFRRFEPGGGMRSDFSLKSKTVDGDTVATHAWEVGMSGRTDLLEAHWNELTPTQRGAAAAGVSVIEGGMDWIPSRLPACELDAVATCELACNALFRNRVDILGEVLESSADLTGEVRRYEQPGRVSGRFADIVSKLSCRCIDLVLEAAIIRQNLPGIRMALKRGANPDIPVWILASSFSEKHCALSYCIDNRMKGAVKLLLSAGANPNGIPFCATNLTLYQAISKSDHALAAMLLKKGASFADSDQSGHRKRVIAEIREKKPKLISPARDYSFGHSEEDKSWAQRSIGSLIPLVPIEEKPCFYEGHAQGGVWRTFLDVVGDDVSVIRRYEALGLDTRLSAEEFLSLVNRDGYNKLLYLLKNVPEPVKAQILFRVRHRTPSFGSEGPMALLPQDDRASDAAGFDPGSQKPLVLPDGSALFVDLDAIAGPGHSHGPCLRGHFWHLREEADLRRQGERTIMRRLRSCWEMAVIPANIHQLKDLLPVVRRFEGRFIRLGCTMWRLGSLANDENLWDLLNGWGESADFHQTANEAKMRIAAQDQSNDRPPELVLTVDELDGYPKEFWPFLERLESGFIGMQPESVTPAMFRDYRAWERKNKREDCFVPDPRILAYGLWEKVPPELKPFLVWDDLFDSPGFRHRRDTEYDRAMSRKSSEWWNDWIMPRVLEALQEKGEC